MRSPKRLEAPACRTATSPLNNATGRLLALVGLVALVLVALTGCRLDVEVDLAIAPDGTGELTITATADADIVRQAPGLAQDLRFEDAEAAGWIVEGPAATEDGGLMVTIGHPVTSAVDATSLLDSLGPPFNDMMLERRTVEDETRVSLAGELTLSGFEAFADSDLLAAAGGAPFADQFDTAGVTPEESIDITFRAALPGAVEQTSGRRAAGGLVWDVPLDGTSVELTTETVQRPAEGGWWARPLAVIASVALVAWLALATALAISVLRTRRARHV
ncbi:MAG: hypothetical protein H0U21_00315 [Acidimicrobiia bacterium]|nr:hypothetical protein [Acidimicrobiia bacterium]